MKQIRHLRKGIVIPLVAFCLAVMMGFVAIVVDGGLLLDRQNRMQTVADAAAIAAAEDLFANWRANQGYDPKGTAAAAAVALAAVNGFPDITVNIPPQSGLFVGKPGTAEVIVNHKQRRYFSTIFGSADIEMHWRAVAQGKWVAGKMGILVLNPTAPGAPLIANSNATNGAVATGGGVVTATELDIGGSPGIGGSGTFVANVLTNQPPTPDPLAYLPEPDPKTMIVQSKNATHISGTNTTVIFPGVYKGGISVTGQGMLIMQPGIYYMDGGGFAFTGQGGMQASGVMIVNAPNKSSDVVNISGSGAINLTPPTTGLYAGISLWQSRSSTNTVSVTGNGGSILEGTFYVAGGTLNVTGNGGNDVLGSQYISDKLVVNGNGNFAVNWDPNLVAKTRQLGLVE